MKCLLVTLIALSAITALYGQEFLKRPGFGQGRQDFGRYQIRDEAYLFYWLFYTQATDVISPYEKPLVIWLSRDSRYASSSYGNFVEIGPLFVNGTKRSSSWVNYVNLLFVDSPIGAGFSNVESNKVRLATNNQEAGADVVLFLIKFYKKHPKFRSVPTYIFGERYGGRLAVEVAKQLVGVIKENRISVDFRGVALGAPWISPIDSCLSWANYLFKKGWVDEEGRDKIAKAAELFQNDFNRINFGDKETEARFFNVINEVQKQTNNVDFDNVSRTGRDSKRSIRSTNKAHQKRFFKLHRKRRLASDLYKLMNTNVREAFGISANISYAEKSLAAHSDLFMDYMKSVTSVVGYLLDNTDIKVVIYNGEFELYANLFGTVRWIDRLHWSGSSEWRKAEWELLTVNYVELGAVKKYKNLYFYRIRDAGLEVPKDNPEAGIELLRRVTKFDRNYISYPDLNMDYNTIDAIKPDVNTEDNLIESSKPDSYMEDNVIRPRNLYSNEIKDLFLP